MVVKASPPAMRGLAAKMRSANSTVGGIVDAIAGAQVADPVVSSGLALVKSAFDTQLTLLLGETTALSDIYELAAKTFAKTDAQLATFIRRTDAAGALNASAGLADGSRP